MQKATAYYVATAVVAVLLLLAIYLWHKDGSGAKGSFVRGRDGMSVGAHWDHAGTYGHTSGTLPSYGLSGYAQTVPTSYRA